MIPTELGISALLDYLDSPKNGCSLKRDRRKSGPARYSKFRAEPGRPRERGRAMQLVTGYSKAVPHPVGLFRSSAMAAKIVQSPIRK